MPTLMGKMSLAFKDLKATMNQDLEVRPFAKACSFVTSITNHLNPFFGFALIDLTEKIADIDGASRSFRTLKPMVQADIEKNNVYTVGSHSRNLLRVKRVIEMVKLYGDNSFVNQGLVTVFGQNHGEAVKAQFSRYLDFVPTKAEFLDKLGGKIVSK
ncbi:hypothetical protein MKW92_023767, partial [Papaver armeniacum]